jgi:hypothetical protein
MTQCSRNSWDIKASPEQVYKAFLDPKALEAWQAPGDMSARIHNFDPEVGYQMSLFYTGTVVSMKGKTTAREDKYSARFIELIQTRRLLKPFGLKLRIRFSLVK